MAQLGAADTPWIFRGQEDAQWPLTTRLQRILASHAPDNALLTNWENSGIDFFKRHIRSYLTPPPEPNDLAGWLSLMQHYGAPTRLLDWTFSPFVACYFALAPESNAPEAVIWGLNAYAAARAHRHVLFPMAFDHLGIAGESTVDTTGSAITRYPALDTGQADKQNERIRWAILKNASWPLPVLPLSPDPRMQAQQGLFTCAGDLRLPVDHLMHKDQWRQVEQKPGDPIAGTDSTIWPLDSPKDVIRKCRLSREMREPALHGLSMMGITQATLFPGLDGLGRATAMRMTSGARWQDTLLGGFP